MVKVYVAGKFEEKERVREAQVMFQAVGHELTHDWTRATAADTEGAALVERLAEEAEADYFGASECEVFVLLHNDACKGAFAEMGIALASGALVIVVGGRCAKGWPIFYFHPSVIHVGTVEEAVDFVAWTENYAEPEQKRVTEEVVTEAKPTGPHRLCGDISWEECRAYVNCALCPAAGKVRL